MKNNEAKKKLDIDDRMTIQGCLHKKYTVIKISEILKVHKTTIYRELARNSRFVESKVTKFDVCKTRNRLIVCNTCIKKAILTITFPKYNIQFGILINKGSPSSVRII